MQIQLYKLSDEQKTAFDVYNWAVWTKEISTFAWHYDTVEECLIMAGAATVTTSTGTVVSFGAGDFVRFPAGMDCTWQITSPIRKHYRFL